MRSYQQFCPAARALDVVGERWSLLVIRDLLTGPKRYTDLQAGLPGIGPNVLADRLRSLEGAGLIAKRRLPPPAASTVYELTELGSGLRPVLTALFGWGLQLVGAPATDDAIKASWWLPAIEASIHAGSIPTDLDDTYELRIGDEVITIDATSGDIQIREGPAERPDAIVRTDHETFSLLGRGRISPLQAIEAGKMTVEGDPVAAERLGVLFALEGAERAPATS
jgi:DNA-binding HxlR family transcriptional regulator/putative sterol carrier protein